MSREALLSATNSQRSKNNENALEINSKLNKAAQAKADDMAKRNYWSHNTPDGKAPWTFIAKADYSYEKAGENLAYGFATSDEVVSGWMNSPPHRANVLDSGYKDVGFGFANNNNFDNNGAATVVVAMYGAPIGTKISDSQLQLATSSTGIKSYSSLNTTTAEPQAHNISKVQAITYGAIPGIQYLVGMFIGGALMYLGIKHALAIRKVIKEGEKFIVKHPLLDAALVALLVLCILAVQSVGVIR